MGLSVAETLDYWGILAGLGLFLFAMLQMEAALKALAGRSQARFLRRQSESRAKAMLGGLMATILLQSSSVVSLMVLAFVGAGLLALPGALAIVFGSNLGTTFTGWIVATLGFKVALETFALPLIGVGALLHVFSSGRWSEVGRALLSLGLLLFGLELMKTSVASVESVIDVSILAGLASWQYLLFGVVVAAVIQSSSATMMLTLTALHAGIVTLPDAAAVAIGADLGTTTTVVLGALKGSVHKRQVAAGHVLFNAVTDALAFALLLPLLAVIAAAGITDPLYALVAFHSLFNLLGLAIFMPVLLPFARLLQRWVPDAETHEARYLVEVSPGVSTAALAAVRSETARVIGRAMRTQMAAFDPPLALPAGRYPLPYDHVHSRLAEEFEALYGAVKRLEGEIVEFAVRLQTQPLPETDSARLEQFLAAVRHALHGAKAVKDVRHNLADLSNAHESVMADYSTRFRSSMQAFMEDLFRLLPDQAAVPDTADLGGLLQRVNLDHSTLHDQIYVDVRAGRLDERYISNVLNVNRELLNARVSVVYALSSFYFEAGLTEQFEQLTALQ